jgi:hypothetical protein
LQQTEGKNVDFTQIIVLAAAPLPRRQAPGKMAAIHPMLRHLMAFGPLSYFKKNRQRPVWPLDETKFF